MTRTTLKALLSKLPVGQFIKPKSYILPLAKVERVDGNILHIGKYQVPMGRSLCESVLDKLIK